MEPIRKGITPSIIVDAAVRLIDAEGEGAMSMRRLGAVLGVAAMALYNHFPDRNAILDAVAERALGRVSAGAAGKSWQSRLRRLVASVHALADQHPRVFAVVVDRPNRPRAFFPLMSESMDVFRQAGLNRRQAVRWYHTFLMLIHGYSTWRSALQRYASRSPDDLDRASLTAEQLQDWQAVHAVSAKAQFDHAVDVLIDAIQAESDRIAGTKHRNS